MDRLWTSVLSTYKSSLHYAITLVELDSKEKKYVRFLFQVLAGHIFNFSQKNKTAPKELFLLSKDLESQYAKSCSITKEQIDRIKTLADQLLEIS